MEFIKKHFKFIIGMAVILILIMWFMGSLSKQGTGIVRQRDSKESGLVQSFAPVAETDVPNGLVYSGAEEAEYTSEDNSDLDRKVILRANYTIEVEQPEQIADEIRTYLKSVDGFLDDMQVREYTQGHKQATLTLRVPSDKFDEVTGKLKEYGYVKSENISSRDVTAQYNDNDRRIQNLLAREEKVREFFDRADDVAQTIQVYQELASLREQIEQLQTTQKDLDRQVSYSTIAVTLVPQMEVNPLSDNEWNFGKSWTREVNGLIMGAHTLVDLVLFLVMRAIVWGPVVVIIYLVYRLIKRRKK